MLDVADKNLTMQVDEWLSAFECALSSADSEGLTSNFLSDSYWRDVLAFTWLITTVRGAENIGAGLSARAARVQASGFKADRERTPPRCVTPAGRESIAA